MVALRPTNEWQGRCRRFGGFGRRTAFRLAKDGRSRLRLLIVIKRGKTTLPDQLDAAMASMVSSNCDRCQNSRSK
jgi:hypothetical protein